MKIVMIRSQLLLIKGVFLSDLTVKAASSAPYRPHTYKVKIYNDIPTDFTGIASWPTTINIKCWHCDEIPKDYPRFVPTNPRRTTAGDFHCGALGVFHTWNCAAAYIDTHIPERTRRETRQLLCLVESIFSGKRRAYIPEALPRTILRDYSGEHGLTRVEYEAKLNSLNARGSIFER